MPFLRPLYLSPAISRHEQGRPYSPACMDAPAQAPFSSSPTLAQADFLPPPTTLGFQKQPPDFSYLSVFLDVPVQVPSFSFLSLAGTAPPLLSTALAFQKQ